MREQPPHPTLTVSGMKKWTKDSVLALIGADGQVNGRVVEKMVYTVWIGQTDDEQATADVKYDNRQGFATRTRHWGTMIGRLLQRAVDDAGGDRSRVKWGEVIRSPLWQAQAVKIARFHARQTAVVWNRMNAAKAALAA